MTKKHQCDVCKKVKICVNAIPSRFAWKKNKKGNWYVVNGYWLCKGKDSCYKFKQLSGEIW